MIINHDLKVKITEERTVEKKVNKNRKNSSPNFRQNSSGTKYFLFIEQNNLTEGQQKARFKKIEKFIFS